MSNKKCRLCCSDDNVVDVFNNELENVDTQISYILLATGIDIRKEDCVPTTVCSRCLDIVGKFHHYRLNAIILDKKLKLSCGQRYERPFTKIEDLKKAALDLYFKDENTNDEVKGDSSMSKCEGDVIKDETRGRKRTVFDSDTEDEVYIRKRTKRKTRSTAKKNKTSKSRRSHKVISETSSEDDCIIISEISDVDSSNNFHCKYDLRVRKKISYRSKGNNKKKRYINKWNMRASTRNCSEVTKLQENSSAMPSYRHLLDSETDSDFPYSTRLLNPNTCPIIDSDSDGQLFSLNCQKKIESNKDQALETCTKNATASVPSQDTLPLIQQKLKDTPSMSTFRKTIDESCLLNRTTIDYKSLNENGVNKIVETPSCQEEPEKANFQKKTQQRNDISPCLFNSENSVHYRSSETESQSLLDTRFLNLKRPNSQKEVENVKNCTHAKLKKEFNKHFIYFDDDDLEKDCKNLCNATFNSDVVIIEDESILSESTIEILDSEDADERLVDNTKSIDPILTSNRDNLILDKNHKNLNQSVNKCISNSDTLITDPESILPEVPIKIQDDEDGDIRFDSQKTGSVISTFNNHLKANFNFENLHNNSDLSLRHDRVKHSVNMVMVSNHLNTSIRQIQEQPQSPPSHEVHQSQRLYPQIG